MGSVSTQQGESSPLLLTDQSRFSIASINITNSRGNTLLRLSPNAYPATRYVVARESGDEAPVEYVQDPETAANALRPSFLMRLSNHDDLNFHFSCILRQQTPINGSAPPSNAAAAAAATPAVDSQISGLTFIFASTPKEIENLVVREFHADPNLHKNPNVQLVGDYATAGNAAVQFTWTWKWRPPKPLEDRGGGWRTSCSFVEYNQRAHRLDTLASFDFWVHSVQRLIGSVPKSPGLSNNLEVGMPPRLRVPSAQSIESRVSNISDSDGEGNYRDYKEPQSPGFEAIPENGFDLVPAMTANSAVPVKVDVATCKPGEDPSLNEDGPLFRATMRSLEQKTGNMRLRMKRVLRTAEAAQLAQQACNQAVSDFTQALKDASSSNANAVQPALEHYFEKIARQILDYEKQNTVNLQKIIIDPVSKLYNLEIKQADYKKREFDEESKEYYAYVGKYLGQRTESMKEKKQKSSDEKYQAKRRTFELKRFDYSSFMHDLHGGRKDQEVLSQLTKYAEAQTKSYLSAAKRVEEMVPQLDALVAEVKIADQDFQLLRTEREEKRRMLETSSKLVSEEGTIMQSGPSHSVSVRDSFRTSDTDPARAFSIGSSSMSTSPPSSNMPLVQTHSNGFLGTSVTSSASLSSSPGDKFRGIRDLQDNSGAVANGGVMRREGLLWALNRPGSHVDPKGIPKPGWHKFWIVLDQGKLSEYVNWKEKLDLHMDPIDLRMASVREARNSDRRFCFEVITPQFTRVYQAPSEDDMKAWIGAINNALQSAFENKNQQLPSSPSPVQGQSSHRKDIAAVLTGKSSSFSGHRQTSNPNKTEAAKAVSRYASTGDKPAFKRNESQDPEPSALLQRIRNADEGNKVCADCGSDSKVDWCSINLGVLLCIECSGIHRSLGTHISKVRSLTLDTAAFTLDIIELLLLIGNRVSNMIWEAKLDRFLKPSPQSTRDQRLHFITAKYSDRTYVHGPTAQTPDDHLLTSIKRNDIQNVLHALAQRSNPNAHDRVRSTHAIYLALAAADPAAPSGSLAPSTSTSTPTTVRVSSGQTPSPAALRSSATLPRKPFPIAELLLQNGASVPVEPSPFPLSEAAKMYMEFKKDQKLGKTAASAGKEANGDNLSPLPHMTNGGGGGGSGGGIGNSAGGGPFTPVRDREWLIKRNSGSRPKSRTSLTSEAFESLKK